MKQAASSAEPPPRPGVPAGAASAAGGAFARTEEIRMRLAGRRSSVLGLVALVWLGLGGGPAVTRAVLLAVFSVSASVSIAVGFLGRSAAPPSPWVRTLGLCWALSAGPLTYHLGPFSPVALLLSVGILQLGFSVDRAVSVAAPVGMIAGYVVAGALEVLRVVPPSGFLLPVTLSPASGLASIGFVAFVFLSALWQVHRWRGLLTDAFDRSLEARLLARRRELERDEAKAELEHIQRAAAGYPGPWTGYAIGSCRLAEVIGRGGMGEVYAAVDQASGEPRAVKLMHPGARPELRERFLRELQIAARLSSEHIVTVFEVGETEAGVPFMVMERLVGRELSEELRHRQLAPPEVVELVKQVAEGLDVAHRAGVVHRDLKPQNIFGVRGPDGGEVTWKIIDFGVAKLAADATLTGPELLGTPGYMAPEQVNGSTVGPETDIFALGAVAYRLLAGTKPFEGADVLSIVRSVLADTPSPVSRTGRVSNDVDVVLSIAMAKYAGDRFASAGEMAAAFEAAVNCRLDPALRARSRELSASPVAV